MYAARYADIPGWRIPACAFPTREVGDQNLAEILFALCWKFGGDLGEPAPWLTKYLARGND